MKMTSLAWKEDFLSLPVAFILSAWSLQTQSAEQAFAAHVVFKGSPGHHWLVPNWR